MGQERMWLLACVVVGLVCCTCDALRFVNVRPGDRATEANTRQTFPRPPNSPSWAPWQASSKRKNAEPGVLSSADRIQTTTIPRSNEGEHIAGTPPIYVVQKEPNPKAYFSLLRPHNIAPSFGLVAAGALVASHTMASLSDSKVLLTALAAASVSIGSCVLNDWFDIELDRINKPDRPLVTGEVVPAHALAMALGFLLVAVLSAWAVHPVALQVTIIASVGLTSVYTPLLKPLPLVKNFVVAAIIGAAIAAGGMAAGAGAYATLTPAAFTFFVIAHREILMDITDVEGDKSAGIRTIPALVGRQPALTLATFLLTAGVASAAFGVLSESVKASRAVVAALCALFVLPLYANVTRVSQSNFSEESLGTAIEQTMGSLALVLGLMGYALR